MPNLNLPIGTKTVSQQAMSKGYVDIKKKINESLRVKQQHTDLEGQSSSVFFRHTYDLKPTLDMKIFEKIFDSLRYFP